MEDSTKPPTVWMSKLLGISGNQVLVFLELLFLTEGGARAYGGGIRTLAEDNGLSYRNALRILDELVEKKLIKRTKLDGSNERIGITASARKKINAFAGYDKMSYPLGQNVTGLGQNVTTPDAPPTPPSSSILSPLDESRSSSRNSLRNSFSQSVSQSAHICAHEENDDGDDEDLRQFVDGLYSGRASEKLKSNVLELKHRNSLRDWEMKGILRHCFTQSKYKGELPSTAFIQKVIDRFSCKGKPKDEAELLAILDEKKHRGRPFEMPTKEHIDELAREAVMAKRYKTFEEARQDYEEFFQRKAKEYES